MRERFNPTQDDIDKWLSSPPSCPEVITMTVDPSELSSDFFPYPNHARISVHPSPYSDGLSLKQFLYILNKLGYRREFLTHSNGSLLFCWIREDDDERHR